MRKIFSNIIVLFIAFTFTLNATAQSTSVTDRTPEQEASRQTEKLQQELNLTNQQAKSIYDINLKYARERKQSNKRTDAMNRIKKKNEEINRVLDNRQREELQTKRSTVQSVEIDGERRYTRTDSKGRVDNNRVDNNNNSRRNSNTYTNSGTTSRNQDRPVRTDFNTRQPLNNSSVRGNESRTADRPVRSSSGSARSQTDTRRNDGRTNVERSSPNRTIEGSSSSNTRATRSESQRSSGESGSRR